MNYQSWSKIKQTAVEKKKEKKKNKNAKKQNKIHNLRSISCQITVDIKRLFIIKRMCALSHWSNRIVRINVL